MKHRRLEKLVRGPLFQAVYILVYIYIYSVCWRGEFADFSQSEALAAHGRRHSIYILHTLGHIPHGPTYIAHTWSFTTWTIIHCTHLVIYHMDQYTSHTLGHIPHGTIYIAHTWSYTTWTNIHRTHLVIYHMDQYTLHTLGHIPHETIYIAHTWSYTTWNNIHYYLIFQHLSIYRILCNIERDKVCFLLFAMRNWFFPGLTDWRFVPISWQSV